METLNGAYACNYLTYMFDSLNWYSYRLLRLILLGLIFLSVMGLYLCLRKISDYFSVGIYPVYSFALILLPLLFYREYHDVYLWFCGAMGYLLPTIGTEFGVFSCSNGMRRKNGGCFLLAILAFAFMSGCVLEITGFGMWLLLVIIVLDCIYNSRLNKGFGLPKKRWSIAMKTMASTRIFQGLIQTASIKRFIRTGFSGQGERK